MAANKERAGELDAIIQSNRHDNQVIGYIGSVTLPPLMLAAEMNADEKRELDGLQVERDRLYQVKRAKACS
jgi:hypothetical protein